MRGTRRRRPSVAQASPQKAKASSNSPLRHKTAELVRDRVPPVAPFATKPRIERSCVVTNEAKSRNASRRTRARGRSGGGRGGGLHTPLQGTTTQQTHNRDKIRGYRLLCARSDVVRSLAVLPCTLTLCGISFWKQPTCRRIKYSQENKEKHHAPRMHQTYAYKTTCDMTTADHLCWRMRRTARARVHSVSCAHPTMATSSS